MLPPSWIVRGLFAWLVISPKVLDVGVRFGVPNWGRLRVLMTSNRNWKKVCSVKLKFFKREVSQSLMASARRFANWLGKVRMLNTGCAALAVWNAAVLK